MTETLYLLALAVDTLPSLTPEDNLIERAKDPVALYRFMIGHFIQRGEKLHDKLDEAKQLTTEQLKTRLNTPPYSEYFIQEGLPKVALDLEALSRTQLRELYECCLLEEQVRATGIKSDGDYFYSTLIPPIDSSVRPYGDCNGVSLFYASIASVAGSHFPRALTNATSLRPETSATYYNLGYTYYKIGNRESSINNFRQYMRTDKRKEEDHLRRGGPEFSNASEKPRNVDRSSPLPFIITVWRSL